MEVEMAENFARDDWYRRVALFCIEQQAISRFWQAEWKIIATLAVGVILLGIGLFGIRLSVSLLVSIFVIIGIGIYSLRYEITIDDELREVLKSIKDRQENEPEENERET
jgi:hypothetical protein